MVWAETVASVFPAVSPERLVRAVARYRSLGIRGRDPVLPLGGFKRLRAGLESGGLVSVGPPFERAVDNSLAQEILAEDRPPP